MKAWRVSLILPILGIACSVDTAKSRYQQGDRLWQEGRYAAAVVEFEKAESKDPKGKIGLIALFRSAMTQSLFLDQQTEALRKFRLFIATAREGLEREFKGEIKEAQRQVGDILFSRLEQYEPAIAHYRTLLASAESETEMGEYLFRIGKAQFQIWQFDEAVATFEEIVQRFPGTSWVEKAAFEIPTILAVQEGRGVGDTKVLMRRVIDLYNDYLRRYPQGTRLWEARFGIAAAFEELGQLEEAEKRFLAIRDSYPVPGAVEIRLYRIAERKQVRK